MLSESRVGTPLSQGPMDFCRESSWYSAFVFLGYLQEGIFHPLNIVCSILGFEIELIVVFVAQSVLREGIQVQP